MMDKKEYMAEWSTAYINDLPDSAFLYIAPGGEKDDDGRTTPRSLRYFPVRDEKGQIDLPHLRNAIAQAPKANLSPEIISKVQAEGRKMLEGTREEKMDDYDKVDEIWGMDVIVCTSAPNDDEARELLRGFNFPFRS